MGLEKDLPPGEQLIALFRPFLEHLASSNLSPKTIQKQVDNMWALGGEFIRELNYDPPLRKKPVQQVLLRCSNTVDRCCIREGRMSNAHSTPRAASSSVSSKKRLNDAPHHPGFRRRGKILGDRQRSTGMGQ
jgi:hypothetical protein